MEAPERYTTSADDLATIEADIRHWIESTS